MLKILVSLGEGRSLGYSVLLDCRRGLGTLDITVFTTHTHCGFATGFYAKTVSMSAGRMLAFTYHVTLT